VPFTAKNGGDRCLPGIMAHNSTLEVVGDDAQSIYGFRGASEKPHVYDRFFSPKFGGEFSKGGLGPRRTFQGNIVVKVKYYEPFGQR